MGMKKKKDRNRLMREREKKTLSWSDKEICTVTCRKLEDERKIYSGTLLSPTDL